MPAQGTALGIGSGVENSNALKGQNRFVVKDPQGVALGFPVSAPSGQQKSATPKLAEGGWGGSGAGWRVPCCRAIKPPLYPPFARGDGDFAAGPQNNSRTNGNQRQPQPFITPQRYSAAFLFRLYSAGTVDEFSTASTGRTCSKSVLARA